MSKLNLIVAVDKFFGISKLGVIPWKLSPDLKHFAMMTTSGKCNQVIMGRKTYFSIPPEYRPLKHRQNIVISNTLTQEDLEKDVVLVKNLKDSMSVPYPSDESSPPIKWIIGGADIYRQMLLDYKFDDIHLTYIDYDFECDTFFPIHLLESYRIINSVTGSHSEWGSDKPFYFLTLKHNHDKQGLQINHFINQMNFNETGYLILLNELVTKLEAKEIRETRNGSTASVFSRTLTFDLTNGFPILTTKKIFWRGIVEELLFFLKGDTNGTHLSEKNIHIWSGNTTREFLDSRGLVDYKIGDLGPMYGWQWRHFGAEYIGCDHDYTGEGFDQLRDLLSRLLTDPFDRRLLMTTLNPPDISKSVLAPCHSLPLQFYVDDSNRLNCNMYQRSADIFLGVPFNISSTSLLTELIAHVLGLKTGKVTITFGDLHLYTEHLPMAKQQLSRNIFRFPLLNITKSPPLINKDNKEESINNMLEFLEKITFDNIKLKDYKSWDLIKAQMKA
jgi:dihydrofolate reductase/thymidylate synthase